MVYATHCRSHFRKKSDGAAVTTRTPKILEFPRQRILNRILTHPRPNPYRPFVRLDVFPIHKPRLIGKLPLTAKQMFVQLPLPEPKPKIVYKDFHYTKLEESA